MPTQHSHETAIGEEAQQRLPGEIAWKCFNKLTEGDTFLINMHEDETASDNLSTPDGHLVNPTHSNWTP